MDIEELKNEDADAIVKAEGIIEQRVRAKEAEISDSSRFIAAIVCTSIAAYISHHSSFSGLGHYSSAWSGFIGFVVGAIVGERIAFTMLGALACYIIMKD